MVNNNIIYKAVHGEVGGVFCGAEEGDSLIYMGVDELKDDVSMEATLLKRKTWAVAEGYLEVRTVNVKGNRGQLRKKRYYYATKKAFKHRSKIMLMEKTSKEKFLELLYKEN